MRSLLALVGLVVGALAACECGYSVNSTDSESYAVFTELIESDFLHLTQIGAQFGWEPQDYNVSAGDARGTYGKMAASDNVFPNPLKNIDGWSGSGKDGNAAGLQLWVRANLWDDMVPMGEVDGARNDMLYGSYRIGMKLTPVNGTCSAFFWFRNDSQEIDVELLSRQFSSDNSTINLVLQSPESLAQGYNAADTPYYQTPSLPFDPSYDFHEYRFDFTPSTVTFYADGQLLTVLSTQNLSYSTPGRLVINHWSNGNAGWSGGPPSTDAFMTVMYVKAYFNSSNPLRQSYLRNCPTYDAGKVCQIPDQLSPPVVNASTTEPPTYFFSMHGDQIPGQNTSGTWGANGQHSGGVKVAGVPWWAWLVMGIMMSFTIGSG